MRFGWRERYESRGSRPVLREAGVKFPGLLTSIIREGLLSLIFHYNFEDKIKKQTQEEACKKAGGQGKIKSEVSFMNYYISGKFSDPLEIPRQF